MKKRIFLSTLSFYITIAAFSQHDHGAHEKQAATSNTVKTVKPANGNVGSEQLPQLLASYYNIKNALVTGDAGSAASNATAFVKTVNTVDFKLISEGNIHILAKDAGKISSTKDLQKQREYFAAFSSNMAAVAKALKVTDQPIYVQYCPMKKASWLSSEKQVRNPYYGSTMLTCGEVRETLNVDR